MPAKNEEIRKNILATLKGRGAMGRGEIASALREEPHKLPLRQMRDEGLIEQRGERGQAVYVVAPPKKTASVKAKQERAAK